MYRYHQGGLNDHQNQNGTMSIKNKLSSIYYDSKSPGAFGGINKLARVAKTPVKKVKKWLSSQRVYSLHKPVRKRFPRNRMIAYGKDESWQADLVEMRQHSAYNEGNNYLLT